MNTELIEVRFFKNVFMFLVLHFCSVSDVVKCGSQTQKLLERAGIQLTIHRDSLEGQGTEDLDDISQSSLLRKAEHASDMGNIEHRDLTPPKSKQSKSSTTVSKQESENLV